MLTQRTCAQAKSASIPVVGKAIGKFHMIPLIP
jgi:hypothetical protein